MSVTFRGRMWAFQDLYSDDGREQWTFDLEMGDGFHVQCLTTGALREALVERFERRDPTLETDVVEVSDAWTRVPHSYDTDIPARRWLHLDGVSVVGHSSAPREEGKYHWWLNPVVECSGDPISVEGTVRRLDIERRPCYTRIELDSGALCIALRAQTEDSIEPYRQWVDGLPNVGERVALSGLRGTVTDHPWAATDPPWPVGPVDIVLMDGPGCQFGNARQLQRPRFGGVE